MWALSPGPASADLCGLKAEDAHGLQFGNFSSDAEGATGENVVAARETLRLRKQLQKAYLPPAHRRRRGLRHVRGSKRFSPHCEPVQYSSSWVTRRSVSADSAATSGT
jgi:hypothetical protein